MPYDEGMTHSVEWEICREIVQVGKELQVEIFWGEKKWLGERLPLHRGALIGKRMGN